MLREKMGAEEIPPVYEDHVTVHFSLRDCSRTEHHRNLMGGFSLEDDQMAELEHQCLIELSYARGQVRPSVSSETTTPGQGCLERFGALKEAVRKAATGMSEEG